MNEGKLSPEQIENWRKILFMQLGPYACIMPAEDIQKIRDNMQNRVNILPEARAERNPDKVIDGWEITQTGTLLTYFFPETGAKTIIQLNRLNEVVEEIKENKAEINFIVTKKDGTIGKTYIFCRKEFLKELADDLYSRLDKINLEAI